MQFQPQEPEQAFETSDAEPQSQAVARARASVFAHIAYVNFQSWQMTLHRLWVRDATENPLLGGALRLCVSELCEDADLQRWGDSHRIQTSIDMLASGLDFSLQWRARLWAMDAGGQEVSLPEMKTGYVQATLVKLGSPVVWKPGDGRERRCLGSRD